MMTHFANAAFDPETVTALRAAFDRTWRALPLDRQTDQSKGSVLDVIMRSAAAGERDPVFLSELALKTLGLEVRDGAF